MSSSSEIDPQVAEFISITNSSKSLAEQFLLRNDNDLLSAVEDFYATVETSDQSSEQLHQQEQHEPPIFSSALSSASLSSTSQPQGQGQGQGQGQTQQRSAKLQKKTRGGITTFRDLNNDDDDDLEDERTNHNFFTGGEKSALQVEDPNKDRGKKDQSIIDQIFQRARDQMNTPDDRPSARQLQQAGEESFHFSGTGFKLGDGNEPSETVEDPHAQARSILNQFRPKKVNREITFWKQGFTVGDSALYSYNDPKNQRILSEIEQGRVPIAILNVDPGDDVDVTVSKRTDEDYVPPKRKVGGYHGKGQRLGSPVPGEATTSSQSPTQEQETPVKDASSSKPPADEGEGDTAVQIRFANGKRVSHKFNSSDPITTVYEFVRSHPNNADNVGRSFSLSHAFPVKPIDESNETSVADAKLKNAVIVQRWN